MANDTLIRIIRAPFFLAALAFSFIPATFIFATVAVGSWFENALHRIGVFPSDAGLLALAVVGYALFGIAIPAYAGYRLIGVLGGVLLPLLVVSVIAAVDRW